MIKINGAGPAGLSTAIELSKISKDYDVTVYEKEKGVGTRFNGSFQFMFIPGSNVDGRVFLRSIIPQKILKKMFLVPIHAITVSTQHRTEKFHSLRPIWWAVKRGPMKDSLDYALYRTAKSNEVNIKFNSTSLDAIVNATGGRVPSGIAREFVFDTDIEDVFHIILDKRFAPGGYAYLCVINQKATLCVAVTKNMSKIIEFSNAALEIFKKIYNMKMNNVHAQTNYVSFDILQNYIRQDQFLTGEAGGLQDGLFGFGLWYAITSGQLAAQSILYDVDYNTSVTAWFEQLLKTGKTNRFIYEIGETLLGNRFYDMILKYAKNKPIRRLLKELTSPTPLKTWVYDFIG
ncbi:NAD(P)-binding protein [Candidatus Micrarchaeota archaeon]|nr:NAD(P)-binding protein [Candidatus Micrarchaeota archaeon]